MKLSVTILEDCPQEADRLKNELETWSRTRSFEIEQKEYRSGEEFFQNCSIDTAMTTSVFFLDIQLGKMSGIDVAKQLRKDGYRGTIIFLTAYREYVFHGYEVHALNYLLKPVQQTPLFLCLDEIANDLIGSTYLFRNKQEIIRIPYHNILTFSSSLHYVDILTVSGNYRQYSSLGTIIEHLPNEFIRTHRSFIVNLAHIYKISRSTITLSNNMTLPISRSYLDAVMKAFADFSTRFDDEGGF